MWKIIIGYGLLILGLGDCPLEYYPSETVLGYIDAQINNEPVLHTKPQTYTYILEKQFKEDSIDIAIGVVSFGVQPRDELHFFIDSVPSPSTDVLQFKLNLKSDHAGWNWIRFSFLASQSYILRMGTKLINHFSVGVDEGIYAVYSPIANIQQHLQETKMKVFISGVNLKGQPLNDEYYRLEGEYKNFKKFSSNKQLIKYFAEALQEKNSLSIAISDVKLVSTLLSFSVQTTSQLESLQFSYILWSEKVLSQKHFQFNNEFTLVNGESFDFIGLRQMGMVMAGVIKCTVPRDQEYDFSLMFEESLGRSIFQVDTNLDYLTLGFAFVAFQTKQEYVCENCEDGSLIFEQFCVSDCPRGYSQVQHKENTYCEICSINDLKVIDPETNMCTCARRHYLDYSTNKCKPCAYHCLTCESENKCQTCDTMHQETKRTLNHNGQCECPLVGYYDDKNAEDIVCQKCHPSCLNCEGTRIHDCTECQEGKYLDSFGHCLCERNYRMRSDGNCVCEYPNRLIEGSCYIPDHFCSQNQIEITQNMISTCQCVAGYIQVLNQCIKCGENQVFDQDALRCRCVNQTVMKDGNCVPCSANQSYDALQGRCICVSTAFEADDGSCVECPKKMAYIKGKCDCIFNYYFNSVEGRCKKCIRDTDGPKCRRIVF